MSIPDKIFNNEKPIIGMVHLLPLPGSPLFDFDGGMTKIIDRAFEETRILIEGGVDGIQFENQWDRPFEKGTDIKPETTAAMSLTIGMLKREFSFPMGVNVHLNGSIQAMAIAIVTGCQWIRVFELANAYISNAGFLEAAGPELLRYRMHHRMEKKIKIFGDFHVKHGSHQIVSDRSIMDLAHDVQISLADGLIITGVETGKAPSADEIKEIKSKIDIPLFIGSGLSLKNLPTLLPLVDGAIVGTAFKHEGNLFNKIDKNLVSEFMSGVNRIRNELKV